MILPKYISNILKSISSPLANSCAEIQSVTTTETKKQLKMAIKLAKIVITGSMIRPASIRGSTKNPMGSSDIVSRASICSEIFMLPISAASDAPNLPARTSDNTIGHNSNTVLLNITLITVARGIISEV